MNIDIATDIPARINSLLDEARRLRARLCQIDQDIRDCKSAARIYGIAVEIPQPAPLRDSMGIRGIALRRLAEAGATGLIASDLKADCGGVHPKTIGMTLYRLKKDGAVVRVGSRTWKLSEYAP